MTKVFHQPLLLRQPFGGLKTGAKGAQPHRVEVGEGEGQCVRDIRRRRTLGQLETHPHQLLHLGLGGPPIPDHAQLDRCRGVAVDRHAGLLGGQADHASGVGNPERRDGKAAVAEDLLQREGVGMKLGEDFGQAVVEEGEAAGQREIRGTGPDDARLHQRDGTCGLPDEEAVAGDVEAGVDAEDAQKAILLMCIRNGCSGRLYGVRR